jgi:plasmid stabilization system protein ParE
MVRKIVWTKPATLKLKNVVSYLERDWGSFVAQNFLKRTNDIIELLSEYPFLGTMENPKKNIRGFLLTKHNRLFYRVTDE